MLSFPGSSREPPRPRGVDLKDEIFKNLCHEITNSSRDGDLSFDLKEALEELGTQECRDLVNTLDLRESTPLFEAAKCGNVQIAKYLIETCGADLEVRGTYDGIGEGRPHVAPPLWIASVYGGLTMVKYLLSRGASVNATSNSGSTSVRSACFMSNKSIVETLVEAGADVTITNNCGGSCLTNAVQCPDLCLFLIHLGIDVNAQDIQLNTALHYAVMERRLETTKVLVENGANIFLQNIFGQSSVQIAAFKGEAEIFEYLTTAIWVPFPEQADMFELMGTNYLHHKGDAAMEQFIKAAQLREREGIQKSRLGYCPAYASRMDPDTGAVIAEIPEYSTTAQWESIVNNQFLLSIQDLLIKERILGPFHKQFLKKLDSCGTFRYNHEEFFYTLACREYALRLYFHKEQNGILSLPVGRALQEVVEVHMTWKGHILKQDIDGIVVFPPCPFELLMKTFSFVLEHLPEATRQVQMRPYFPIHRKAYDVVMVCLNKLLYLLLSSERTNIEMRQISMGTEILMKYALPVFKTGDTMLHLAMRRFGCGSSLFSVPNVHHVQFLIRFGADVNAVNKNFQETPLHILLKDPKYEEDEVAEELVNAGAHLDQNDSSNFNPLKALIAKPFPGFPTAPPLILQCITAKYISTLCASFYAQELPPHLLEFVLHHSTIDTCERERGILYQKLSNYNY